MKLMGAYYGEWLTKERLLDSKGCRDAGRVRIVADTSQRTLETGRALAESLMPGCAIAVQSQPGSQKDPLFSGAGTPDPELSLGAVSARLGPDPQRLLTDHRAAIDALQLMPSAGGTSRWRSRVHFSESYFGAAL